MKKLFSLLIALVAMAAAFQACSTDVDIYADYKDITIIYGLLDPNQDTNFVKINRAFLGPGDANDIATIADSCNYPGKLDSKIIVYRAPLTGNNYEKMRVYQLDTLTVHDKDLGMFYAPDQLVYYTTGRIFTDDERFKYKYELQVDRGDTLITATTSVVGGKSLFMTPGLLNFSSLADLGKLKWTECPNTALYDILIRFHYAEVGPTIDTTWHVVDCYSRTAVETTLPVENGMYIMNYPCSSLFSSLPMEMGDDTLKLNVERIFMEPSIEVVLSAGGEELNNYIMVNGNNSSIVQTIPEYTNINGGYGVFSSRTQYFHHAKLSSQTVLELLSHTNWGFRQAQ
ncbi:MAG: hypothetical protein J5831_02095 [Bacteroidales bacterium]|nr:hypothetical protein [Bacteroidales bacterium]